MAARKLACALALAVLAGCETRTLTGIGGATGGIGGDASRDLALVGDWSLILLNYDASGALTSSSETRWRFGADGSALRTSIATSFMTGVQDIVQVTGTWTTSFSTITVVLNTGTLQFPYRLDRSASGDVLILGTLSYLRR